MSKEFWDKRYENDEYAYGIEPNGYFKQFVDNNPPGKILLPGEGEGRNAVYAASNGWQVTALDQSREGKHKTARLAEKFGISVEYQLADLTSWNPEPGKFDAIALIFLHLPPESRLFIHKNLITSLKEGGFMVVEAFSKDQLGRSSGGPQIRELLYDETLLAHDFQTLDRIELYETDVLLNEGAYHQGMARVVRLLARKRITLPG